MIEEKRVSELLKKLEEEYNRDDDNVSKRMCMTPFVIELLSYLIESVYNNEASIMEFESPDLYIEFKNNNVEYLLRLIVTHRRTHIAVINSADGITYHIAFTPTSEASRYITKNALINDALTLINNPDVTAWAELKGLL